MWKTWNSQNTQAKKERTLSHDKHVSIKYNKHISIVLNIINFNTVNFNTNNSAQLGKKQEAE